MMSCLRPCWTLGWEELRSYFFGINHFVIANVLRSLWKLSLLLGSVGPSREKGKTSPHFSDDDDDTCLSWHETEHILPECALNSEHNFRKFCCHYFLFPSTQRKQNWYSESKTRLCGTLSLRSSHYLVDGVSRNVCGNAQTSESSEKYKKQRDIGMTTVKCLFYKDLPVTSADYLSSHSESIVALISFGNVT